MIGTEERKIMRCGSSGTSLCLCIYDRRLSDRSHSWIDSSFWEMTTSFRWDVWSIFRDSWWPGQSFRETSKSRTSSFENTKESFVSEEGLYFLFNTVRDLGSEGVRGIIIFFAMRLRINLWEWFFWFSVIYLWEWVSCRYFDANFIFSFFYFSEREL